MTDLRVAESELKRLQLIAELHPEERAALALHLEPLSLGAESVVFEEGEPGEGAVFVVSGQLCLTSSRALESVAVGSGTALGALALVTPGPREARAETTSACELLVLRRSSFRRFRDDEPLGACRLLEAILCESTRLGRAALALADSSVDPLADDD